MAYISVTEKGVELIHDFKPTRRTRYNHHSKFGNYWIHGQAYLDYVILPKGTIKLLIGRELTFEDKPVCLTTNKIY